MGVLYDYFRAADDAAAVRLMAEIDGGPVALADGRPGVDAIDCKGIDPSVTLGELVALVRNEADADDPVKDRLVWSGAEDGPWLTALDDATRDTLASITADQTPELSARWGRSEELAWDGPLPDDQMQPVIEEVSALARRARDADEHLYCWSCL
ncbi:MULTISPECIES: hypothetical protein [unclassified Micromonospora]|uniref:hypothetical protein n=1 Tax=unclassified Micromonospora TaxID=2617518 RepID=UPI0010344F24|nr:MULTISPECIES: hypothetical protein [unclassified Micromonospora]QKW14035.1 hypothetical protein HUT12_15385 [Verrucosispora sp. NA02020]TBL40781.1 hypothetical protein EYA84_06780 [Verrucosispora sp. SN26_14.1]